MSKTNIYILLLEGERYYIGKSNNVNSRYQEHINGNGSAWTRKYKPISIQKIIKNVSSFEEDKITKEYMSKYGIDKVRGGSYVELELSDFHISALQMEIWAAKDLCTQCGRKGHFVTNCYAKTDISGNKIEYDESTEESSDDSEWECEYCDITFTNVKMCEAHEKKCKIKNIKKSTSKIATCYRCGNTGHYSPDCYASRHIKGYILD
jgi:predicted GIY-YIG superfamily endonuclease